MNLMLILMGVALCASLWLIRKPGRAGRILGLGLAILALVLCGVYWFQAHEQGEKRFTSPYQMSTGYALGKALARELPEGGRVLVWQMKGTDEGAERMARGQIEGFRQGVGDVRFEVVPADPDRHSPDHIMTYLIRPSKQAFFDELAMQTGIVAVVSFIGLPATTDDDLDRVLPAVFAVDSGRRIAFWMKHPKVKALVVPKSSKSRAPPDADLDAVFQARYSLVTPKRRKL